MKLTKLLFLLYFQKAVEWRKLENKTSFVFPGDLCKIDYRYGLVTHGYHRGQGQKMNTGIQWETCTYQSGNGDYSCLLY
jgi:hypothetical protein